MAVDHSSLVMLIKPNTHTSKALSYLKLYQITPRIHARALKCRKIRFIPYPRVPHPGIDSASRDDRQQHPSHEANTRQAKGSDTDTTKVTFGVCEIVNDRVVILFLLALLCFRSSLAIKRVKDTSSLSPVNDEKIGGAGP